MPASRRVGLPLDCGAAHFRAAAHDLQVALLRAEPRHLEAEGPRAGGGDAPADGLFLPTAAVSKEVCGSSRCTREKSANSA